VNLFNFQSHQWEQREAPADDHEALNYLPLDRYVIARYRVGRDDGETIRTALNASIRVFASQILELSQRLKGNPNA
jgi:hypothetical protein